MANRKSKKTSELEQAERAMKESELIGALWQHLTKKGEEMGTTLQHLESINPTLRGYAYGFKHGFELACEIVSAASDSAGLGEEFTDHRSWEVFPEFYEKHVKVKQ